MQAKVGQHKAVNVSITDAGAYTTATEVENAIQALFAKLTTFIKNENLDGSSCTGTDGSLNRVITLGNTTLTRAGLTQVYRNGAMLMPTDLTIDDLDSSTTITFTGVNIFDDDLIRVIYFV